MFSQGGQQREKIKYQLLYHSIQEKLNEILESKNCSIKNIRVSSQHEINQNRNVTLREEGISNRLKTVKKVAFHSIVGQFNRQESNNRNYLRSKKSIIFQPKVERSLNCSFLGASKSQIKSNRSFKANPQLEQSKKYITQILHKITIILATKISHKQIIEWFQAYCHNQKVILLKLFLKYRKLTCNKNRKIKKSIAYLQIDQDVLFSKLEMKLRDAYLGEERFITTKQLKQLSTYLQTVFLDKMKMKTKQFQESISLKMRSICERIRKQDDNQYFLHIRKKPTQISNFLLDVKHFEGNFGSLRKINSLNRVRFKILNDADAVINKQVKDINTGIQAAKRMNQVNIIS